MIDDSCPDCGGIGHEITYCIGCDRDAEFCTCTAFEWWTLYKCPDCRAVWDPY